jgi:predicted XRE-type DNA-binding protein
MIFLDILFSYRFIDSMPKSAEFRLDKIKKFLMYVRENKDDFAAKELEEVFEDIVEEHQNFVTRPEIRELIIEMREGFKMMDKRFNDLIQFTEKRSNDLMQSTDKRFSDFMYYTEKRSNELMQYIDKRFDDLIQFTEKRFNDLIQFTEKRFNDLLHHVDKRFEDMNARINFLQWVMAFFMSLLFGVLTYFNYKQMDLLNKILESNQQIQAELKNK